MKSYIEVDGSVFGSAITPVFRFFFNNFNTLLIKKIFLRIIIHWNI
jgi:hypothetical protein